MAEQGTIPLTPLDLAVATSLVLVAGLLSLALRLGMERKVAVAALRMVVQLLLVGYILEWVFAIESAPALLGVLLVMIVAAGRAAVGRSSRTYPGAGAQAVVTLLLTGCATTFTVTSVIIGVDPWYRPQYVVPLLGMVLGNSLTGISLCLDTLLGSLAEERERVELELSLGATRWEAARAPVADAVRRGMIPILNSMMVAGIVSLPGMMTGQILQGASPLSAVEYQIVVFFMLAASTSIGSILMALLVYRRLFNERHQLRAELIETRAPERMVRRARRG
jgi:putative ABC transport system permease protein